MFRPARTGSPNVQTGQPSVGAGAQQTGVYSQPLSWSANGKPVHRQSGGVLAGTSAVPPDATPQRPQLPVRPTKGRRSWLSINPGSLQRGGPEPENNLQHRPKGSMPNVPPVYGGSIPVTTPYYSRGAAATVQNFGRILYNPIGAGVVAGYPPQANYAVPGQNINGQIFWTSQQIPTSITPQSLTDPQELAALLDPLTVYAVARVNG